MKITELIAEAPAYMDISMVDKRYPKEKGYKPLGSGYDQRAYLSPDGWVVKVFGSSNNRTLAFTPKQKTFIAFYDYCRRHPDNEFLPNFGGWEKFEHDGRLYLEIKMERLFQFSYYEWLSVLEELSVYATDTNSAEDKDIFINNKLHDDNFQQLIIHLGEDGFNKLWDTIYDLSLLANKLGNARIDLHSENWMLGSDGNIVLSDPIYTS